jgi:hypothetical protein
MPVMGAVHSINSGHVGGSIQSEKFAYCGSSKIIGRCPYEDLLAPWNCTGSARQPQLVDGASDAFRDGHAGSCGPN